MSTRGELLASIANEIKDYRAGEISEPTPDHVDRWVSQFTAEVQLPLLTELSHILDHTYFSRAGVAGFFDRQLKQESIAGDNPCEFWKRANFLNIQEHGESQKDILSLFGESLKKQCGIRTADCGSKDGPYFYLDDVLFSGTRIGLDLKRWIASKAPAKATVKILVIGTHRLGEWQCTEGLKTAAKEAGKQINIECRAAIRFENRRIYRRTSEVLWPVAVPEDATLAAYMAREAKYPFEARTAGGVLKNKVFTGEPGRQLIERELLMAGMGILSRCKAPKKVLRPLGFGHFGLGFGSTIVTYRNCPNNCPLALWWGDPTARSGPFKWYPLLPRRTHAQSDNFGFGVEA